MKKKAIRAEFAKLYREKGAVRASEVVERARNVKNPLHDQFEWDDTKAGHSYRLIQARTLIRAVHFIEYAGKKETLFHVPAVTVSVGRGFEGRYELGSKLVRNKADFARAKMEANDRLVTAKRAIEELALLDTKKDYREAGRLVDRARQVIQKPKAATRRRAS